MALSLIHKKPCPECKKPFVEASRLFDMSIGECGHIIPMDKLEGSSYDITSSDGKELRPYQVDGIKFVELANVRALIADEQGLGKTVQGLGLIKLHPTELLPAAIVTKTTVKHQWFHEIRRWCGIQGFVTQVIGSSKEMALPGFDIYITSYDLLKNENVFSMMKGQIKLVIIDECQTIKNHLAGRSKALQEFTATVPHVLALSGTPIKNNAGEYFTILNILHPERFPEYSRFLNDYCDHYWNGYGTKVGGLVNPELFKDQTSDFIIRRTRAEAAPEIPEVDRQFFHCELSKQFNNAYREAMRELDALLYADEDENTVTSMIAIMTKMRKITGLSKVPHAIEDCIEFIDNEPDRKMVIFVHHHAAVTLLEKGLNPQLVERKLNPAQNLHAGLDAGGRANLVERFKSESNSRVLIASTLAAGEGLNLQFVDDAIMLERQWNPANEEQAEGRFARVGRLHPDIPITIKYMIASETIDEYFTELVEAKRAIVKSTLDGEAIQWDSGSLMKELAGLLLTKGKSKWKL